MKSSNKAMIVFIFMFLFITGSVVLVQTVYEIISKNPVNVFTIFRDTFVEPIRNGKKKRANLELLNMHISSIDKQKSLKAKGNDDIEEIIENAVFSVQDLRKTNVSVNRYVSDSLQIQNRYLDSLENCLHNLQKRVEHGKSFESEHETIRRLIKNIEKKQNGSILSVLTLPVKTLFRHTLFNTKYLRMFEKDIEESSVIENSVRPAFQYLRFRLSGDYGDKVISGRNGWLFYKKDVEYLYLKPVKDVKENSYNNETEDNPLSVIIDFKNQLREYETDLLVVIIPTKPAIYPDLITPGLTEKEIRSISHTFEFIEKLRENGVNVVNLFDPLHDERKRDSVYGDSIYLQKDTHWKTRGITRAAKVTAEAVREFDWYHEQHETREYVLDSVYVDREGDILKMTQLTEFKMANHVFQPEKTLCYQVFSVQRDSIVETGSRQLYRDDYSRSRILVLGDSFSRIFQTDSPRGAGWISHIAYELSEPVASIVNDGGASTIVRQTLSRKLNLLKGKKLVIWEVVERDLRFGAQGWKQVSIKDEL